jgi:hypothetical protein
MSVIHLGDQADIRRLQEIRKQVDPLAFWRMVIEAQTVLALAFLTGSLGMVEAMTSRMR